MSSIMLQRRLTQLFADNKKSYEALVQQRQSPPELSHLHLKLRIQKDRLIAWGIQWSDRSAAAQTGDIDQSLDKAGISDLVASIMCSIRELLDEAESLQPLGPAAEVSEDWSSSNIRRLEEILKDLTTSIDTLCDLSRSKVEGSEASSPHDDDGQQSAAVVKRVSPKPTQSNEAAGPKIRTPSSLPRRDDLTDLAFIDPSLLHLRNVQTRSGTSPPSYESVASGSDSRVVASFLPPPSTGGASEASLTQKETLVLLDYRQAAPGRSRRTAQPDRSRFEELLLALLKFPASRTSIYTGVLKLTGWTLDATQSRSAFIYEIPPIGIETDIPVENLQPRSLLSFLQNGGDTDNNNIPSLENRFKLACNVASSVLHLHEISVVHRNLNSNNLLFFLHRHALATQGRIWKTPIIRKPYLTGFHQSSCIVSGSEADVPFLGLYHHPMLSHGHGSVYELAHDYYSLGLILLEIGLWMPIGKFWKSRYSLWDFKARLQDIYLKKLLAKCGDGYMNAVLACITAADLLQHGENDERVNAQAQLDRFREEVAKTLERLCLMDNDVEPRITSHTAESSGVEAAVQDTKNGRGTLDSLPSETVADRSSVAIAKSTGTANKIGSRAAQEPAKIRVWSHELPALYLTYWTTTMFPKLERILRKALDRMESYTIDLFMAGRDPDTARPTVYMECTSTAKCQRILRHLNKELRLFDIKVVPGQIIRSKAAKKKRKNAKNKAALASMQHDPSMQDLNPHYQQRPICGASIGACLNGSHLPPVTFGGAVLLDGEPFGMSVHHMLEDEEGIEAGLEDQIDLQRSMAPSKQPMVDSTMEITNRLDQLYPFEVSEPAEAEDFDTSSVGYPCSSMSSSDCPDGINPPNRALYPFEISDNDIDLDSDSNQDDPEHDFWLSPSFDANAVDPEDDECYEMGDTDGILPGRGSSLAVTQPALDDVSEGFFPSPEDVDTEHLSSHSLGYVHASSGLRRSKGDDSLIHEIDWALIKIHPERLPPCLRSPTGPTSTLISAAASSTASIIPSSLLASRSVHAHTRSSGLFARGTILPTMRLVRMPGRVSPSHSWQIRGSFGGGGDSGAWVFDDATGAVCGHVLAYSDRSGVAYIAPMDVMVQDIEKRLGMEGRVVMPTILPLPEDTSAAVPVVPSIEAAGHSGDSITARESMALATIQASKKANLPPMEKEKEKEKKKGKAKVAPPATPPRVDRQISNPQRERLNPRDRKRVLSTPSPALPTSPPILQEQETQYRQQPPQPQHWKLTKVQGGPGNAKKDVPPRGPVRRSAELRAGTAGAMRMGVGI